MRVLRPNQFQLRLGWLRVATALLRSGPLGRDALMDGLISFSEAQDAWLKPLGTPSGRISPRAAPDLVRMAETYGIYDSEAGSLKPMGLVLSALDEWDPAGPGNPMAWAPPIDVVGLRLCLEANGDAIFPFLKQWDGDRDPADLLAQVYERLQERPGGTADDALKSARSRLRTGRNRPQVVYPVLEPLRELGLLTMSSRNYRFTEPGRRFQQALRQVSTPETLLADALANTWAAAKAVKASPATPERLASVVPALLRELPPLLQGQHPTSSPMGILGPWLQARCLAAGEPVTLELSDFDQYIRRVAGRSGGKVYLRPGLLVDQSDLHWTYAALDDENLWRLAAPQVEREPPRAANTNAERPRERASIPAEAVARDAPDVKGSPPPAAPDEASPMVRGWHAWVIALLTNELGPAHGGPETWLRHLRGELELISPERLARRRNERGFERDFDNLGEKKFFRGISCAAFRETARTLGERPETADLTALVEGASQTGRPAAQDQALILLALERLPGIRQAAVEYVQTYLKGDSKGCYADRTDKAFRLTRWLVEDALYYGRYSRNELAQTIGAEPSLEAAVRFLMSLKDRPNIEWIASFVLDTSGTRSGRRGVQRALREVAPEVAQRIEEARKSAGEGATLGSPEQLLWEEDRLIAPTKRMAEAQAREKLDRVLAAVDFATWLNEYGQDGYDATTGVTGRVEVSRMDNSEPVEQPLGLPPPNPDLTPEAAGIDSSGWVDRLRPPLPDGVERTLLALRAPRLEEDHEDRPARRVAQLWAAVEHLVVGPDDAKGPGVIRALSAAAALLHLSATAGVLMRRAFGALHRRSFEQPHQDAAVEQWRVWFGDEEGDRYERVKGKVLAAREILFGEEGRLRLDDKPALELLAKQANLKFKSQNARGLPKSGDASKEGRKSPVAALVALVGVDDPLTASQLLIFSNHLKSVEALRKHYRHTRMEIAGLLATAYDVRNRLHHASDVGRRDSDPMLSALYRRLRVQVDQVVLALLHPRFHGQPMPNRWATIETLCARMVGQGKLGWEQAPAYPDPYLNLCLLD